MFGLSSLVYVRDYVQGLQRQQNPSACAQENDAQGAQNLLGVPELSESKEAEQRKENVVVETSSANLGLPVTHESSSTRNRTSTPLGFLENTLDQNKSYSQKYDEPVPNGNIWSPRYLRFNSAYTNHPQKTRAYSERFPSLKEDNKSQPQQFSSPFAQQRQVKRQWEPRDFREQVIRSTTFGDLTKAQCLPQRHVSPLSSALRSSELNSSPIAQSGNKLRHLSPLRESSGDIHRSPEIEQQSLGKYSSFLRSTSRLYTTISCAKDTQCGQISLTPIKAIK